MVLEEVEDVHALHILVRPRHRVEFVVLHLIFPHPIQLIIFPHPIQIQIRRVAVLRPEFKVRHSLENKRIKILIFQKSESRQKNKIVIFQKSESRQYHVVHDEEVPSHDEEVPSRQRLVRDQHLPVREIKDLPDLR